MNEEDIDAAFYDAVDNMNNEKKLDSHIFSYILKQKDIIIKELREKIKILNDHIELLNEQKNQSKVVNDKNHPNDEKVPLINKKSRTAKNSEGQAGTSAVNKGINSVAAVPDISDKMGKSITTEQVGAALKEANSQVLMRKVQQLSKSPAENTESSNGDDWVKVTKRKRRFLVGNTDSTCEVETIPRLVQLHVTRLKPGTQPQDLQRFLAEKLLGVKCEEHPSRRPDIYASMKVTIDRQWLKTAWTRETWPNGAIVSFFAKKRMLSETTNPQTMNQI
ncbi:unnamed protein product [Phaedon cochleariae]|uniref:Uncharacterized protein n=1 Tax=Phaedon cochleariae TaxID=80249 RepID=A0A9N9SGE9_PHACE|nr:unnamed protein product [Phaedon cochleariae]